MRYPKDKESMGESLRGPRRLRSFVVNVLYNVASAACMLADALSPTTDEIWRDRRWREYRADKAKGVDGPPLTAPTGTHIDGLISVRPAGRPAGRLPWFAR